MVRQKANIMIEQPPLRISFFSKVLFLIFGVLLPGATIAIEAATGFCASTFFDPLPSVWHLIIVALVPLINLAVLLAGESGWHYRMLLVANGLALGISSFYTLLFLPLLPLALLAVLIYGMGLLPLAPLCTLICGIVSHFRLKKAAQARQSPPGAAWPGLLLALALLLLLALPEIVTGIGMRMVASPSPEKQRRGLDVLRRYGDNDTMLRACYQRPQIVTDLVNSLFNIIDKVSPQQAREVYYRTTGMAFDSVPPPRLGGVRGASLQSDFDFDADQGSHNVGMRLKGLVLSSSRLDGSLDADAALGYLEWTMVFQNNSPWRAREARCRVLLPPGACVSRLTLWINGEEREAAFAGRGQVSQAYQKIVRRQRDPVLVTMQGPDRIMLQCFPVPSNGQVMKVRLGITCPLRLAARNKAILVLPCFIERNFFIPSGVKHSLWLEAKNPLVVIGANLETERPNPKNYALRGLVRDRWLASPTALVAVERPTAITHSWAPLPQADAIIRQKLSQIRRPAITCMVLVVDASVHMRPYREAIAASLSALPTDIDFAVIAAGDDVEELVPRQSASAAIYRQAAERLRRLQCIGGSDNVPALLHAWQVTQKLPGLSVIVWLHGPQPVLLQSTELLRQNWERRPDGPIMYEVPWIRDSNLILRQLQDLPQIKRLARQWQFPGG